jgi:hypothetical protein
MWCWLCVDGGLEDTTQHRYSDDDYKEVYQEQLKTADKWRPRGDDLRDQYDTAPSPREAA